MKVKKILLPLAVGCVAAFAFAAFVGCGDGKGSYTYDGAKRYSAGDAVIDEPVTDLEVDWVGGDVQISYEDRQGVSITETSDGAVISPTLTMRYYLENGTLKIKYAGSGAKNVYTTSKNLKIALPSATYLKELEVESYSADVTVAGISCQDFTFESLSGNLDFTGSAVHEWNADTDSGNIRAELSAFYDVEAETVSGAVELIIGADMPVSLSFRTVSGTHDWSDFEVTPTINNMYRINGGGKPVTVETTSGAFKLTKAAQ